MTECFPSLLLFMCIFTVSVYISISNKLNKFEACLFSSYSQLLSDVSVSRPSWHQTDSIRGLLGELSCFGGPVKAKTQETLMPFGVCMSTGTPKAREPWHLKKERTWCMTLNQVQDACHVTACSHKWKLKCCKACSCCPNPHGLPLWRFFKTFYFKILLLDSHVALRSMRVQTASQHPAAFPFRNHSERDCQFQLHSPEKRSPAI